MIHIYKGMLKIYRAKWKTHINIWSISTRYCEQSAGSARLQTDLKSWSGKHLNPTIHVHVFSSHVYSGGDPIKLTHEPFTNANGPRMSKIHTCVLPPLSFTLISSEEGWLTGYIMPFEGKSNYCKLNTSRTRSQWQSCMETLGMDT